MVSPKYSSKHSGSGRARGRNRRSSSHASSRMSTRPSSPRCNRDSIDSVDSRDSSYDRLISPSKYSDMSTPPRRRPPHYDRMVCEAVARLKSRKGSSIQEIAKNLEHKYPDTLKLDNNNTQKVITIATKKLVKEGKLVKDGTNYRLNIKATRKSRGGKDSGSEDGRGTSVRYRNSRTGRRSSRHRRRHRRRSRSRSRSRSRRRRRRRSRSRSRSRRRRRTSRSRSRRRRSRHSYHRRRKRSQYGRRSRAIGGYSASSSGRSLKRGAKRRKKGSRKGQTRLSTGRRHPHQKKLPRARRRVKHSHSRRPKSDKLPDGDGSQNKRGWFGGWFGGKGGDSKPEGNDKGSGSKGDKRSKAAERSGGERGLGD